jgi:hypothetical protein
MAKYMRRDVACIGGCTVLLDQGRMLAHPFVDSEARQGLAPSRREYGRLWIMGPLFLKQLTQRAGRLLP